MKKRLILGMVLLTLVGALLGLACSKEASDTNDNDATSLPLAVTQPQNESVVNTAVILVKGTTNPDAVVTVNGTVADVDADGNFSVMVTLEEGPNLIEVYASDFEYREASEILTVVYET
ncbi:MAG: hypothetical protein FJ020_08930 [Chloroflexi bacterium]|nr:hypothetical protein [Chloroflexota bacterium]